MYNRNSGRADDMHRHMIVAGVDLLPLDPAVGSGAHVHDPAGRAGNVVTVI